MKSPVTTHVLDTARGLPATDLAVSLEYEADGEWKLLGEGTTDQDGRLGTLLSPETRPSRGIYRLTFRVGAYFDALGLKSFYPEVTIVFHLENPQDHYHVPLLLSPFGYSTYRGT